ncbi:hypothetical protein SCAR479_12950 [Seiridium cardinale]|uniref:Uncharacterized protein n=1 Tax=Seiridium cardinale TaxID=138064 RepID=A0ABR2X9U5_9PEZI
MSLKKVVLIIRGLAHFSYAAPARRDIGTVEVFGTSPDFVGVQYCGELEDAPIHTTGDPEVGPGFWITNNDGVEGDYFVYENSRDEHPWKYITIDNGTRSFVQVCPSWQGHIARGTPIVNLDGKMHNLGTWAAASLDNNGAMWGALSFLQGSDGGGSIKTTDGSGRQHECTVDLLDGAPDSALATKGSGAMVLNKVVGEGASEAAMSWMLSKCSVDDVYVQEKGPNPVIKSENGRLEWVFTKGRF